VPICFTGISKYLRHSDTVAATHYDFSHIEQSARNRAAVLDLIGGKGIVTLCALTAVTTKVCGACLSIIAYFSI